MKNHILKLLNYPNPFRLKNGTEIRYSLGDSISNVEVQIYDMRGLLVERLDLSYPEEGTKGGLNRIKINEDILGTNIFAGVYFYFVISDGDLLGKGKMLILP